MALAEGKTKVQFTLEDEVVEFIDFVAKEVGVTRAGILANFVEVALDDWEKACTFGLTPRRAAKLRGAVEKSDWGRRLYLTRRAE